MKKQSDLKLVKSMAMTFLYLPVEETEFSPIVVMHPVFENGFVGIKESGEFKMVNILESEDDLEKAIKRIREIKTQKTDYNTKQKELFDLLNISPNNKELYNLAFSLSNKATLSSYLFDRKTSNLFTLFAYL